MPRPLNILKAFEKGIPLLIDLPREGAFRAGPKGGAYWLILGGFIDHVTLTDSLMRIVGTVETDIRDVIRFIAAATGSGSYPIFSNVATDDQNTQFHIIVVLDGEDIALSCDATARARIRVLEWTP